MPRRYPLIANFDGTKFEVRYGLDPIKGTFYVDGEGMLVVPDELPDDPPIQEACDPVISAPSGVWVHEMKSLNKKRGIKLTDGDGTSCLHIVVETEALLSDPWFMGVSIDIGSSVYVIDKAKILNWDGTRWK